MRLKGGLLLVSILLATPALAEKPELFGPKRIVLGWMKKVTFSVTSLPGAGAAHASTNVGSVLSLTTKDDGIQIKVKLPRRRSPQELVLLLYRERGPVFVYHVPLQGRTRLPIRTRPLSTVYLRYGKLEVVKRMGDSARRYMRLAVPPGIKEIEVEVVDKVGLRTRRKIRVRRPSYPRLALAVQPSENSASRPTFRVIAAVAESEDDQVELEVLGPQEGDRLPLKAHSTGKGRWEATFQPKAEGELRVRGTLGAEGASREVKVQARYVPQKEVKLPNAKQPPLTTSRKVSQPPDQDEGLHFELAVSAGFLHNTGAFFSPQFSLAFGATYQIGASGSLGLRIGGSVAWRSQTISAGLGAAADLDSAESRTVLAPLFVGPIYRGPRWPVIPYASANFVVQFAQTRNTASYAQERATLDVAPGFLAQLGAELPVGPTFLFLQTAFLYSRVKSDDVELLAGGVSVEGGLRVAF